MNEFLNPKSMATPGAAGALMMLIANALCSNFPEFPFRYVALILSFVIGAIVFSASTMKVWERGAYWVVNSLIIFSMGVGATNIAANVAAKQASNVQSTSVASAIMTVFTGDAFAQEERISSPAALDTKDKETISANTTPKKTQSEAELLARIKVLEARVIKLQAANERLQRESQEQKTQAYGSQTFKPVAAPEPAAMHKEMESQTYKPAAVIEPDVIPKEMKERNVQDGFFKKW